MFIEVGEGELVLGGLLVVEDAGVLEPGAKVSDPGVLIGSRYVYRKRFDPEPYLKKKVRIRISIGNQNRSEYQNLSSNFFSFIIY